MIMQAFRALSAVLTVCLAGSLALCNQAIANDINTRSLAAPLAETPYHARAVEPLSQWQRLLVAIDSEADRVLRCQSVARCSDIRARRMASLIAKLPRGDKRQLLTQVNRYFNGFPHVSDRRAFRVNDIWLSPLGFIQSSGDCEDFAIAKYFVLRLVGFPEESLHVLLVRDVRRKLDHAVLLVDFEDDILVLDNLSDIANWTRFPHYQPVYAFNAKATWHFTRSDHPVLSAVLREPPTN